MTVRDLPDRGDAARAVVHDRGHPRLQLLSIDGVMIVMLALLMTAPSFDCLRQCSLQESTRVLEHAPGARYRHSAGRPRAP